MSEAGSAAEDKKSETLHYYSFRNTSIRLKREEDRYIVIQKKNILHLFTRVKRFEYSNIHDAEDKYLDLKSILQYNGRSW